MKELQKEIKRVEGVLKSYENRYKELTEPTSKECVSEVISRVRERLYGLYTAKEIIEEEMKRGGVKNGKRI